MIEKITKTVNRCTCERCGYVWESEKVPVACAKCHNNYWNTPKTRLKLRRDTQEPVSHTSGIPIGVNKIGSRGEQAAAV